MSVQIHYLKCWPEPFEACAIGIKTHEVRRQDRMIPYRIGDVLILREFTPNFGEKDDKATERANEGGATAYDGDYTGRELRRVVTCITPGGKFGLPEGVCVMSIRKED